MGGHLVVGATCANDDVVKVLEQLMQVHETRKTNEDHFKVIGYRKAIAALKRYPTRIKTPEEALKLPGIGDKTAWKVGLNDVVLL